MQFLPDQYYYSYTTYGILQLNVKMGMNQQGDCFVQDNVAVNVQIVKRLLKTSSASNALQITTEILQRLNLMGNAQIALIYAIIIKKEIRMKQQQFLKIYQAMQSDFQLQESNAKFTMKCLAPLDEPNLGIDIQFYNAKYCFNKSCYNKFSTSYCFDSCAQLMYQPDILDDGTIVEYCNQIGVDQLIINYVFAIPDYSVLLPIYNITYYYVECIQEKNIFYKVNKYEIFFT
ncbi:unnamed protein product [Paramecium octaurelia]|uniref:Uncharacterized protein n=1 Tax=Paramecium octaurelia TaxID=43137 RepID=A0A8S1YL49_PAROT|nr:unnamed protein product [Paramecium octaurelia]